MEVQEGERGNGLGKIRMFNSELGNHRDGSNGAGSFFVRVQPFNVLVAARAGGASRLLDEVDEEGLPQRGGNELFPVRQLQELLGRGRRDVVELFPDFWPLVARGLFLLELVTSGSQALPPLGASGPRPSYA